MEFFNKGKYEQAIDRFSKLILFFSTSKLHPYSRYMIGQCYLKMKKYEEALQQFELYLKNFPNGDRIKEAEKGIQTSKEKLKEKASPPSIQPDPRDEEKKKTDEVRYPATDKKSKRWALRYAATTKDEGNAADGLFSAACLTSFPQPPLY
jgi:tetratricopeptide (TPR) repeat protein